MPKTRRRRAGDKTLVLIPFPATNSDIHLKSTKGEAYGAGDDAWDPAGDWGYKGWNVEDADIICSDSTNLATKLGGLNRPSDVLYIRGHGMPGDDELESSDHTAVVTVKEIVGMLRGDLRKSFSGIIKIYACNSATDGQLNKSFTQQFADAMFSAGYKSCSFYGYTETLSTNYWSPTDFAGESHKGARQSSIRASEARQRVYPRTKSQFSFGLSGS
jgi:hypothetical protein